jgi:hypothetical protein
VLAAEPGDHWLGSHIRDWSNDIGIEGLVGDLAKVWPVLAFGVGLVLGLTLDTRPRTEPVTAAPVDEPALEARETEPVDRPVPVREEATPPSEAPTTVRSAEPRREE